MQLKLIFETDLIRLKVKHITSISGELKFINDCAAHLTAWVIDDAFFVFNSSCTIK